MTYIFNLLKTKKFKLIKNNKISNFIKTIPQAINISNHAYKFQANNIFTPHFSDSHLVRKAPPSYSDGVYAMAGMSRPSSRRLSRLFMRGKDGLGSKNNRTALLAFFGQVVANEIVMASESGCPIEMHKIEIEKCDEMFDRDCRGDKYIPFHRAAYDRDTGQSPNAPREQVKKFFSRLNQHD